MVEKDNNQSSAPVPLSKNEKVEAKHLLAEADMLRKVPPPLLEVLVGQMKARVFQKNEIMLEQDQESDRMYMVKSGEYKRIRVNPDTGKSQTVEFAIKAHSINTMRILSGEPVFANVECISDKCKVFEIMRPNFLHALQTHPEIATRIAEGLCEDLRTGSKKFTTPLLEQQQEDLVNVPAVSIAAAIESYYRSALNAKLNARLSGVKAELFPNMHIQVPVRVSYICGFKGLRGYFDHHIDPNLYAHPNAVRLATAVSPGIVMAPISSILEASNAGHLNKEPMTTRWMRGLVPRGLREIVFGLGLNQMSDYFEERLLPYFKDNPMLANAAGSLTAGVVSGYCSHVPHNMSTFKLLEPQRSYFDLYKMFVDKSVPPVVDRMVAKWPSTARSGARIFFATLFPRGLAIRTTQIVGSFMILNGTINFLQLREHGRIQRAIDNHPSPT
jgi:hypothetical protein